MAEVTCAICSHWELVDGQYVRVQVKHVSIAAVKACALKAQRAKAGK